MEDVSRCARDAPSDTPVLDNMNIHTVRIPRSAEAQVHHTQFITCMISGGTLALQSACKFLLQKMDHLAIARGRIRMAIGCLKAIGEMWPKAARNVCEIQIIARRVLDLVTRTVSSEVPSLSDGEERGGSAPDVDALVNDTEISPSFESIDSLGTATWIWTFRGDFTMESDFESASSTKKGIFFFSSPQRCFLDTCLNY